MTIDKKLALNFPCDFSIKAMGLANDMFEQAVLNIIRQHVSDLKETVIHKRSSKDGKYISITVKIRAINQLQLDNIYHALTANELVLIAL